MIGEKNCKEGQFKVTTSPWNVSILKATRANATNDLLKSSTLSILFARLTSAKTWALSLTRVCRIKNYFEKNFRCQVCARVSMHAWTVDNLNFHEVIVTFYCLTWAIYKAGCNFFLKKIGQPRPLFRLFSVFSNKQYNSYNKSMWKMSCPSSIRRQDLNPQPSERESPPIITRPGLPPTPVKLT